ncbi:MAG: 5'/3'-nucleotidase SurE [Bacteroidales bacterium]|jgi:5'-nucleotidase|nr:5'/3'-nucleotidase SurE [Bacteroidales bacterium]
MKIVISNDDSIIATGLKELAKIASKYADVILVAPDRPRSAQSHAVTLTEPLRLFKVNGDIFKDIGVATYQCSGTPADCVKIAIQELLHGEKPDFVLSGINHGSNAATNVIYSGTMAAAVEGALAGVPSIGFSVTDHSYQVDFSKGNGLEFVEKILVTAIENKEKIIAENNNRPFCWNVNFPNVPDIKGIKAVGQSNNEVWRDFIVKREDFFGVPYYWIAGDLLDKDSTENTDLNALAQNYATIVPVLINWTAYEQLPLLTKIFE